MIRGEIDILVVDDAVSHCTILQARLRGWGYNVALAYRGPDAFAQVREKAFDLVLCEVPMAVVDGSSTLMGIKGPMRARPILFITAFTSVRLSRGAL
ncbi:response regulator, partial [Salmonella enterica]|uniref:response regulator n=1 Tax=Salmonella enterica TaxID=28901 RepID=UPI00398C5A43